MKGRIMVTVSEVAERLGVGPDTVRKLVARGDLAAYRIGSGLRFNVSDVEAYLMRVKTKKEDE